MEENENEIWLPIKDYEGSYEVSDLARVRSLDRVVEVKNQSDRRRKGMVLKPTPTGYGHLYVTLGSRLKDRWMVHILVYQAFNGELIDGMVIDHDDFNPINNLPSNLKQITHRENLSKDRWRHNHSSKYVGVHWCNTNKKWRASIQIKGVNYTIGYFAKEIDARDAYLDILSNPENIINYKRKTSSKYKWVGWDKRSKKWRSYIIQNGIRINLGSFNIEEEAYQARLKAEKELL